jgi:hypothetical protein
MNKTAKKGINCTALNVEHRAPTFAEIRLCCLRSACAQSITRLAPECVFAWLSLSVDGHFIRCRYYDNALVPEWLASTIVLCMCVRPLQFPTCKQSHMYESYVSY